ncbi:MAG: DnaB protein helicase protein [Actinomycetia bacterium]|nr:DnaB protein helicase protein [Actinomycetes bacterium]
MSTRTKAETIADDAGIPHDTPPEPAEPESWEDMVPLGSRRNLPAFPAEAFAPWLGDMVTAVAEETQTPVDISSSLALGALATAAGGKVVVRVRGSWVEPTNLFIAAVAEPGTRKSAVFRAFTTPLYTAEKALNAESKERRREAEILRIKLEEADKDARAKAKTGSTTALAEAVDAAGALEKAEAEMPAEVQLIAKNVTPEECSSLLAEQGGRLSALSAEGDLFDIICGRYSNGVPALSPFLEGHAGDVLKINRRGRSEYVEAPALTIGVCIQPTVLTFIAEKPRLRGQGLLARFLYSVPDDYVGYRKSEPDLVSDEVRKDYETKMKALVMSLAAWDSPFTLNLAEGARKLVIEFMDEIEPKLRSNGGELQNLRDWASKLTGAAVRIAGLLHLAQHLEDGYQGEITEDTMRSAIGVGRYYAEHAMAAFGSMREAPSLDLARQVVAWLGKQPQEKRDSFTQRDVHRGMQSTFAAAADIAPILTTLEAHGYIRRLPAPARSPKGGRAKSPEFAVHIDLFKTADTNDTTG